MKRIISTLIVSIALMLLPAALADVLNLPPSLNIIEEEAFYGDLSLDKVVLGENVTSIGARAFSNSGLKEITLTEAVTFIADDAFEGCEQCKINAPEGSYAYFWCVEHGYIDRPAESPAKDFTYEPLNGLYAKITKYVGTDKFVVIPEKIDDYTIQVIGVEAFFDNQQVEYIIVPDTVTEFQKQAFSCCYALKDIDMGNGVTTIGNWVFYDNPSLKSISFPASVTTMGRGVMQHCVNLEHFGYPINWEEANSYGEVFKECSKLTQIDVPEGTVLIPNYAFANCPDLKKITLPEGLERIYHHAFSNCTGLTEMVYPSTIKTVGGINGCTGIKEIVIPEGANCIGTHAFDSVPLTTLTIPGSVVQINDYAFYNCADLKTLVFNNGLETIGLHAFDKCSSLTALPLPDSVVSIGNYAFANCSNLSEFHYPASWTTVTRVGGFTNDSFGHNFDNDTKLRTINIPDGVTYIPRGAFSYATYLRNITLPDTIRSIDAEAFKGCTAITDLEFKDGIESIGYAAFRGCSNLTGFNLPDSVTSIGCYAFAECEKATTFHYPSSWEYVPISGSSYDGEYYLNYGHNFDGCTNLKEISITEGTTYIPPYAFQDADSITKITFPSTLEMIDFAAFNNCDGITEAMLPDSITTIGCYAFANCKNLTTFHFPLNWTRVTKTGSPRHGLYYFNYGHIVENCEKLKNIEIPEGVKAIPAYAFYKATGLEELVVPSTLESIGSNAFNGCENLKKTYLGYDVTEIGDAAFDNCPVLTIWTEYGSYALQYAKDNSISYYYLSPDGVNAPSGNIYKGDSFPLYGYARASLNLTEVTATIWDGSGKNVIQQATAAPGVTDYELSTTVNCTLCFQNLGLGTYRYTLDAATEMSAERWADIAFTIVPPPLRVTKIGLNVPNGIYGEGESIPVSGTIIANYPISSIAIGAYDDNDTPSSQVRTLSPNQASFELSEAGLNLSALGAGSYVFKVSVTGNGETQLIVCTDFTLEGTPTIDASTIDKSQLQAFLKDSQNKSFPNVYYYGSLEESLTDIEKWKYGLYSCSDKVTSEIIDFFQKGIGVSNVRRSDYLVSLYKEELAAYITSHKSIVNTLEWKKLDHEKTAKSIVSLHKLNWESVQSELGNLATSFEKEYVDHVNSFMKNLNWTISSVEQTRDLANYVTDAFLDYTQGIQVLDALASDYLDPASWDYNYQLALRELKDEFTSNNVRLYHNLLQYAKTECAKELKDNLIEYAVKGIAGGEVYISYKITKAMWTIFTEETGFYDDISGIDKYRVQADTFFTAYENYQKCFDTINASNGNYSDAQLAKLLQTFELTKSTAVRSLHTLMTLPMHTRFVTDGEILRLINVISKRHCP